MIAAAQVLLDLVDRRLTGFLDDQLSRAGDLDPRAGVPVRAVRDLVRAGGKRIRPAFCIAGYLAAGGDPSCTDVVPVAAGLEMLHVCALIHDDVMDASTYRRGRPTVHTSWTAEHAARGWQGESRRFGESVAILAGDLALIYADQLVGSHAALGPAWAQLRSELIMGQFMDVLVAAQFTPDPDVSRLVARIKSGRYTIHRPLLLGATLAGRPDLAPAFETYGEALGEAFQLRDDLMDAFGDPAATGKPTGQDFAQHKMTLLQGMAQQRSLALDGDLGEIRAVLTASGVADDLERHIGTLVSRGCAALADAVLAPGWRPELETMARSVAYRTA